MHSGSLLVCMDEGRFFYAVGRNPEVYLRLYVHTIYQKANGFIEKNLILAAEVEGR